MKYARQEFERRFLLTGLLPDFTERSKQIEDFYVPNSTIRFRRIHSLGNHVFKLTQKLTDDDDNTWNTSIYLSEAEFNSLLPSQTFALRKERYYSELYPSIAIDKIVLLDVTLFIAEFEVDSLDLITTTPSQLTDFPEITEDNHYTGYALASRQGRTNWIEPI